jgi:hypothetical protein
MRFDGAIKTGAVVLVDIGTENTDLLVATENSLWSRNINVGGNNFTESLVKSFKLSFSKAEALKRTAATSKYARQIFQAMRPVFADLVQELQRSIGFYTATHRDAELTKVIGLGSAFKLPGLRKYVQQNLQFDLIHLERFERINIPASRDGDTNEPANFAVAYGLAVQGLGQAEVTSNLLPPEIARQVVWRKKRPFFAAAAACLILAAGVILFRNMTDRRTLEANTGAATVTVSGVDDAERYILNPPSVPPLQFGRIIHESAKMFTREYGQLSSQGNEELDKVDKIITLLENRAVWLRILAAIHEALPRPDGELGEAESAAAYKAAIAQSNLPRPERPEITIISFESKYSTKVDSEPIDDQWGANVDHVAREGEADRRGFIITLQCGTPHKDKGVFVTRNFVQALREKGRLPGQGFYINRVGVTSGETGPGTTTQPRRGSRFPGRGTARGGRPDPEPQASVSVKADPLTGESLAEDWSFEVTLDVILENLPEKENPDETTGGK